MHHTLSKNQRKLLLLLSEQKSFVQGTVIASKLGISDRTIRNDVAQLNTILESYGAKIEAARGKGYLLHVGSISSLHGLIYADESLVTQDDRVRHIILKLIQTREPLRLGELQDDIYVSHTTLESDLRIVKSLFSEDAPYLQLIRNENSIAFEDDEKKKRLVLKSLFAEDWDYNSEEGIRKRNTFLDPEAFDIISVAAKEVLYHCRIKLNDHGLVSFVFTVVISHYRILQGNIIKDPLNYSPDEAVVEAVKLFCDRLEQELNVTFPFAERAWFEEELSMRRVAVAPGQPGREATLKTDPSLSEIAREGLLKIDKTYHLNLVEDEALLEQLTTALHSFYKRPDFLRAPRTKIGAILKNDYPFSFELTIIFYELFFQRFNRTLSQDDLSELGGYLAAALERAVDKRLPGGIQAVLATDLSYSGAIFLMARLNTAFKSQLQLLGPFSIYEKQNIRDSGCNLILTTTNPKLLQEEENTVLPISLVLQQDDIMHIWNFIQQYKKKMIYPPLDQPFTSLFHEKLFLKDIECEIWEEAVTLLTDSLRKQGIVGDSYRDAVIRRERIANNAFEKGFAIPRAVFETGTQTLCAAAVLKHPVLWGKQKVSLVFMPVVKKGEEIQIAAIFHQLLECMQKKEIVKRLVQAADYNKFLSMLDTEL